MYDHINLQFLQEIFRFLGFFFKSPQVFSSYRLKGLPYRVYIVLIRHFNPTCKKLQDVPMETSKATPPRISLEKRQQKTCQKTKQLHALTTFINAKIQAF